MKKTITKIASLILSAGLILSAAGCGNANSDNSTEASSSELKTIRVALMTGSPDQYAVYIGQEEGIFEKYGVEVETAEYASGINTVDAIQNGTADTGLLADFAAANRFGKTLNDTNLVTFSELCIGQAQDGGLYVDPDYADDLTKLYDSPGIITKIGTVSEYYNWQALTHVGLDPDKITPVNADSNQTGLAVATNKEAGANVVYGAEAKRYDDLSWTLVATSEDIGIRIGSYLITSSDYLDENTELAADYLKALKESIDFVSDNLDDSATKIEAKFGFATDDFKKDWLAREFRIGFTEEGAEQLDKLNEWAYDQGKYEESYNIRDFIDTRAAEIAAPDNVTVNK